MNMPSPAPGGQPPAGGPPSGAPPGQPPQGQPQGAPGGQNPIVQCIQTLGQFVERMAQRDPAQAKVAAQHLQGFIEAIKGGGAKKPENGNQPLAEQSDAGEQEPQQPKPPMGGKKKMGAMPENAKPGAVQVL
jgi:hypothetical protein